MGESGEEASRADSLAAMLRAQAKTLRDEQALGRSPALERLFDFLLDCSLDGRSPKEVEIADRVFGRTGDTADEDASVRVYVHRLRRKLELFYEGPGAGQPVRLTIPKGSYRLTVTDATAPHVPGAAEPEPAPVQVSPARRLPSLVGVLALMVLTAVLTWAVAGRPDPVDAPLRRTQANALWAPTLSSSRPLVIAVGDYFIFGETDEHGEVTRLVREFYVNSPADLELLASRWPERAKSVADLGLSYLPVGVASALRVVVPVVRRSERELRKPLVVPASQLSPDMVKKADIVYLGYLSGLASLRDPVFSGSRFTVGDSYDEIVDRRTRRRYVAGTHLKASPGHPSEDYALISSFTGPTGNRVVVIAGTRDAALMQAAEFATRPESLGQITATLQGAPAFEALLAVESLGDVGLRARLLVSAPRPSEANWSGRGVQPFPDDLDGLSAATRTR